MSKKHPDRYTLRSGTTVIVFWLGIAVLAIAVGVQVVQGQWRVFAFLIAPALLLAWLFWIALYRPAVHYDGVRAIAVNIGRRHVIPWGHVTGIRQAIGMVFELDNGKRIVASGAPAPRRSGVIGSAIDRRTRPVNDQSHDAEILDGVRRAVVASTEPVVSRWEVIPLVVGAVLIIAVVLEFAIGI